MRKISLFVFIMLVAGGCELRAAQTATPSPTATLTETTAPTATPTASPTATETATWTVTPSPTLTETPTQTPSVTPTATITLTPSITPESVTFFSFDNWELIELPANLQEGLDGQWVVYLNSNDQQTVTNLSTAQPPTDLQTLYFGSPTNPANRIPILELRPSVTGNQVYVSPRGNAIAYFAGIGADAGLYMLNFENGLSARVVPLRSLIQRGFLSVPQWSPDGNTLALMLATGYEMDIFLYARDGSFFRNLTQHGAYDLWPVWSPDGTKLAFVSDRATCSSWIPGEAGACDALTTPPPAGGQVYMFDLATEALTLVSDEWVGEPPRWINNRLLSFASGDFLDLLNPRRALWLADIVTGQAREIRLQGDSDPLNYLSEAWSPDGSLVVFQRISDQTEVVLMRANGELIRRRQDELSLPRFGMSARWSPDGERIAIGGVDGQCPYGVRVMDKDFAFVATGNPPPSMCDPLFSPGGEFVAFTGVNPRVDGRLDIYTVNFNGFGAVNLTVDLRGQMELLGWVSPR